MTPQQRIRERYRREGRCDCSRKREDPDKKLCRSCRARAKRKYDAKKNDPGFKEASRQRSSKHYRRLKESAFEAYGGAKCQCCGEKHDEFLSVDHIEPVGTKREHGTGKRFYNWLKGAGYPPGYRVLCMNCNFALGHNGYCPHRPTEGLQAG